MKKVLLILFFLFSFLNLLLPQETDSITDTRNGRVYRVVRIGDQWWMQENLNIGNIISGGQVPADNSTIEKYCYNNNNNLCDVYGGLYRWDEMMDYHPSDRNNPGKVRGICPEGWHIPTDEEWKELEMTLGMTRAEADLENVWRGTGVGTALQTGGSSGYEALYSGRCSTSGSFSLLDEYEYVWTSTDYDNNAWRRCLSTYADNVGRWNTFPKTYAFSVRCVRDVCLIESISIDSIAVSCSGSSDGKINLTVSGTGPFKYQWSTGDTIEDLQGLPAGIYTVIVTDSLGCSAERTIELTEPDPIMITADYTMEISPGDNNGHITIEVIGGTAPYGYLWSTGDTLPALTGLDAGEYSVKVTDEHRCKDSANFTILYHATCDPEQICMVTIDTLSGKNLVIWESSADECIDHYNIYRDSVLVGTAGYEGIFVDSSPSQGLQPICYCISITDTSGNESALSPSHKPLFLVITRSKQSINLSWSEYEINGKGIEVESYTIYRGGDSVSLSPLVENIQNNYYADSEALTFQKKFYYRVGGMMSDTCHPSDTGGGYPDAVFSCSFSNLADNFYCEGCDLIPPTVPDGMKTAVFENSITLAWNSSDDLNGVRNYNIYDSNHHFLTATVDTVFVFTGLEYSTEYFFMVTAVDSVGNESEQSQVISATTEDLSGLSAVPENPVRVNPNPFNYTTTIRFPNPENQRYQLRIYNQAGKIIKTENNITGEEVVLSKEGFREGLYLFEIRGKTIYRGKLVVD